MKQAIATIEAGDDAASALTQLQESLIEAGFASFRGLPHRSQIVGQARGITFVNDSKATNLDSAAKALAAFDNIRWIAGGLGKEGGISALAAASGSDSTAAVGSFFTALPGCFFTNSTVFRSAAARTDGQADNDHTQV